MKETNNSPDLMPLMLELGSKVNHDLMGYMHVIDFCTQELQSNSGVFHQSRAQDYWEKLQTSSALATEVIRHQRVVTKALRELQNSAALTVPLQDGIGLAFSLSRLLARGEAVLALQISSSKELKSGVSSLDEVIILVLLFDFLRSRVRSRGQIQEKIALMFMKEDSSVPLSFSLPGSFLQESDLDQAFLPADHMLFKYWELKRKQIFKNQIVCARDIIGLLRAKDGNDYFYLQTGLFHINS